MMSGWGRAACLSVGLLFAAACGGDGDGEALVSPPVRTLRCTGVAVPGGDEIGLDCPASADGMMEVRVLIGGPTSSADIDEIKFDLVFDSTVLRFEPPALEGPFAGKDGADTVLLAGVEPADPGRLVVAITRPGSTMGVGAEDPQEQVMTLLFSGIDAGDSSLAFEDGEVFDSQGPLADPSGGILFLGPLNISVE